MLMLKRCGGRLAAVGQLQMQQWQQVLAVLCRSMLLVAAGGEAAHLLLVAVALSRLVLICLGQCGGWLAAVEQQCIGAALAAAAGCRLLSCCWWMQEARLHRRVHAVK
jgi:hypothetical protein